MHDYKDTESAFDGNEPQRFCVTAVGGWIALEYIDMERQPGSSPDLSKCEPMFKRMAELVEFRRLGCEGLKRAADAQSGGNQ